MYNAQVLDAADNLQQSENASKQITELGCWSDVADAMQLLAKLYLNLQKL